MMRKYLKSHKMPMHVKGIVVLFMLFWQVAKGQNLVINGDFEAGNLVGFSSNYVFIPVPTGSTNAGQYGIGKNPGIYNNASFISMGDHTSGNGNMMIVDGTNNGGNTDPSFWRINGNGEICGLTVGESYTFSYYVKSIYKTEIFGASSADIGIKWNNVQGQSELGIIVPTSGNMLVLPPPADWQRVTYTFIPTNSCVRIEMFDRNSNLAGNDFAIDDIELLPPIRPLQLKFAIIPPGCPDGNDGFITAYGSGGKPPYAFSFNGGPFSSNSLLANLGAVSGQSVTLRDAGTPPGEVSVTGISLFAPVNPLDAGANGSICAGQVYQLNATGGSSYTWTAIPEDTSLHSPNIANPVVKPLVKTVYTVTSQVSSQRNLVFNGNFSEGDVGFASDYVPRLSNPNGLQGVYGVVSNAQAFYNPFSACTGTGGTGDPMLVADGSTKQDARIWWQEVRVLPNTNYNFTYFLQSVQAGSPARVETRINNLPITGNEGTSTQTAPNGTCTWQQVTYSWNSGANTSALICLFNRNLSSNGNDFALDNISFSTNVVCTFSRQVEVNVTREEAPTTDNLVQPTCRYPTGSFRIIPPYPDVNDFEYSIDGTIFQSIPQFTNLLPGIYKAFYRRKATGCISQPLSVVINPLPNNPPKPVISAIKQPACDNPGGEFEILSPVGPNFEYSNDSLNYYGDDNTLGALPSGNWLLFARDKTTGCVSQPLPYTINPYPEPPSAPTATVTIQPTCSVPTGTIVVTAPVHINMVYSLDGINWQTNKTFTGVAPNTYNLRARILATGCISPFTSIVVNAAPGSPAVPVASITVQTGCNIPTGTIQVSSPSGGGLEYSVDGTRFQTGTTFAGLRSGTYRVVVKNTSSQCLSTGVPLVINPVPAIPALPTVTVTAHPNCNLRTGIITFTAPVGPNYQYTINGTVFKSDPIFTGLGPGTYLASVKDTVTGCISNARTLKVNDETNAPLAATATVTVPATCANPTGTIVISAPVGPDFEYSLNGVDFQNSPTFTNVPPGKYNIRTRNKLTFCVSNSLGLTVSTPPGNPPVPTVSVSAQPNCFTSTGTILITEPLGVNLEYSVDGISYKAGTTFDGLLPKNYQVLVRNTLTGCISNPASITVNAPPAIPAKPTANISAQPNCTTPSGTIAVTAPAASNLSYSIDGSNYQEGKIFSGLKPGTYLVTVRENTGGCISNSISLVVNPVPLPPAAPGGSVTVQPSCNITTGTIEIESPSGTGFEYSLDGTNWQTGKIFSGLVPNTYEARVRNPATECVSNAATLVVNAIPAPPVAPTASVTVQPSCVLSTGNIEVTAPLGQDLLFSILPGIYQQSNLFSALIPGTYQVRAKNALTGCISNATTLQVNPVPFPPAAPAASVTFQPTCNVPTGTIVVTSPTGTGLEYSINGTLWQTGTTFSGLAPGSYGVQVRDATTFCTSNSPSLVVNAVSAAPATPVASVTVQPSCSSPVGTIVIAAPIGADLEYSLDKITWQTSSTFNALTSGIYGVLVRNTLTGCISSTASLEVNAPPLLPASPVATVTAQPDCTNPTGVIVLTSPLGNQLEYSLNGTTWQSSPAFPGLLPNTYNLRVRNTSNRCISNTLSLVVDAAPVQPATPVATVTVQPNCSIGTGTIVITSPTGPLLDYSVDGVNFQSGPGFTGLLPGNYSVRVRHNTHGCISNPLSLVVLPASPSPPAPGVTSPLTYCQFSNGIQPLMANGTNLKWYNAETGGTGASMAPVPNVTIGGSSNFYVSQTNASGCESPRSVITVIVEAVPVIAIQKKIIEIQAGQSVTLPASVSGQGVTVRWTPSSGLSDPLIEKPMALPAQTTTYAIRATTSQACSASDTVKVIVLKDVVIPNVFSPNGDGTNDKWVIRNLEDYQNASLEVYNRYGQLVYRNKNAVTPWDGTNNGQPVPAGTYYYIIKPGNNKVLNGSVTILR